MNHPGSFISTQRACSRRTFLRASGVALALPLLEAMRPAFSRAAAPPTPRRMFGICNNLGLLSDQFFPTAPGRDYPLSPYLQVIADHRQDFTVLSGVWHP